MLNFSCSCDFFISAILIDCWKRLRPYDTFMKYFESLCIACVIHAECNVVMDVRATRRPKNKSKIDQFLKWTFLFTATRTFRIIKNV